MPNENADMTDEQVASRVQGGDADAFGLLVERFEQPLLRYARRFLSGHSDAEDVVQEAFIKAFTNIRSFDVARKFSPWIYRIAHNEFINAIKKKRREPVPFFDADEFFPHPVALEDPREDAARKERAKEIEGHLDGLDMKYREPLVLYYFQELDYREIADVLHIPISTVGVRLKRAREALAKRMGPSERHL